ncbi:hypothetical protein [Blastococcus sp. CT_GayMR16]|uniref:hypothetical protein n=1 Tax=Blastococcus sp. CT_GayMR16 TaxID=2559607 RepID=UPI001074895D|nr:hypothetical protein [Blastococcus sp. CT_GayMR16]TFV89071.1 hypothetical protein E4P38_07885 [Blastococcus sp. CT_GayMR16]
MSTSTGGTETGTKHAAGAFDVRNVIAALIGFYGVVLVVVGLVDNGEAALEKTDGFNANLWVGLAMIVFAAAFALWSRLRPIVVETKPEQAPEETR